MTVGTQQRGVSGLGATRLGAECTTPGARPTPSRVLYVASSSPVPSKIGPARRNFHMLRQLARFYDVSLLTIGSSRDATRFAEALDTVVPVAHFAPSHWGTSRRHAWKVWRTLTQRCDFVPTHEPGLRALCADIVQEGRFDVIVLSCVLLRGLPLPSNVPIIGDTHNVEFDVLRRTALGADDWGRRVHATAQWRATRREERRSSRDVALLLATSERDREVFEREFDVPHVSVVPNGIDLAEFTPASGTGRADTILYSGLMSYYPNQQAVRWFLDAVFPEVLRRVPAATFVVAGAAPPRWLLARGGERVRVTGPVPDMRPYIEQARAVVAPLWIGGGTRVKILEALAVGRPVISTTVGAEGLGTRHGESILLADDAATFARHVASVLTDEALARSLTEQGRRHIVRHFDWNTIGSGLGDQLQRRLGLVPARTGASC
jgi:glycosyltransferase involved in cell wall biosynthesis